MSKAWKSSDGGSITPLGGSSVGGTYTASATLIAAGVNVRGITIRTASILASGSAGWGWIEVDGVMILAASVSANNYAGELFIPAGKAVTVVRNGGTINLGLTYDIH